MVVEVKLESFCEVVNFAACGVEVRVPVALEAERSLETTDVGTELVEELSSSAPASLLVLI